MKKKILIPILTVATITGCLLPLVSCGTTPKPAIFNVVLDGEYKDKVILENYTATQGQQYQSKITPNDSEKYTLTISKVEINGKASTDYTFDEASNTITIAAQYVTGNIVITPKLETIKYKISLSDDTPETIELAKNETEAGQNLEVKLTEEQSKDIIIDSVSINGLALTPEQWTFSNDNILKINGDLITGPIVIAAKIAAIYEVSFAGDDAQYISIVQEGVKPTQGRDFNVTLKSTLSTKSVIKIESVTIGGIDASDKYTFNKNNFHVNKEYITGNIVITAVLSEAIYEVSFAGDDAQYISIVQEGVKPTQNHDFNVTLNSKHETKTIIEIQSVTIGGVVASGKYTFDKYTKQFKVSAANVTGDIKIDVSIRIPNSFTVTTPFETISMEKTNATEYTKYSSKIIFEDKYEIKKINKVTIDGKEFTNYTFNKTDHTITIEAQYVTGNIVITPNIEIITFTAEVSKEFENLVILQYEEAYKKTTYESRITPKNPIYILTISKVTIGGVEFTDYTFDEARNIITIAAQYVTGNIVITPKLEERKMLS